MGSEGIAPPFLDGGEWSALPRLLVRRKQKVKIKMVLKELGCDNGNA
jgi:hypothetical protein